MADTSEKIKTVIAVIAKLDPAEVKDESRLAEDLGLKSVGRIELAAVLEDTFGVAISNFDIRKPKTVAQVVELVESKL